MATQIVYVSLQGQGNSTNLSLRDTEGNNGINDITTDLNPGDIIQWQVDTSPSPGATRIYSIERVYKKQNQDPINYDLLTEDPTNIGNGVWQGTVKDSSPGRGTRERYNIDFKRTQNDTTQTDDPKLQMNV
ncbi:MAG: hypothetical protein JWQ14_2702 [Adhaeribacter sp.]|nr:hypothetical protein [Adhaeribacter sp.]